MKKIFIISFFIIMLIIGGRNVSYAGNNQNTSIVEEMQQTPVNTDNTTATMILPNTGLKNMTIISICIVSIIGIGSFVRSKTIKTK